MTGVTKAQMRDAAIVAGIPANVVDQLLGQGLLLVDLPTRLTLRLAVDDGDTFHPGETRQRIATFTDRISGQLCILVIPFGGQAGIEHPDCRRLADLSQELDAFYCQACKMNGRVSGAWCADLISRATAAAEVLRDVQVDELHERPAAPQTLETVINERLARHQDGPAATGVDVRGQVAGGSHIPRLGGGPR